MTFCRNKKSKKMHNIIFIVFLSGVSVMARPQLIGFYPHWARAAGYDPQAQNLSLFDQVIYGYYVADNDGGLISGDKDQDQLQNVLNTQNQAQKALWLAIGGWDQSEQMANVGAKKEKRQKLCKDAMAWAQKGVQGFVIDWTDLMPERQDVQNRHLLLKELKDSLATLKSQGKIVELILLVPLFEKASVAYGDSTLKLADKIVIQSEEQMGLWVKTLQPLSDIRTTQKSMAYWQGRGVLPSQIIFGLPGFAKSFDGVENVGEKHRGIGSGNLGYYRWHELNKQFKDHKGWYKTQFDSLSQSEFAVGNEEMIVYLGPQSIRSQGEWLRDHPQYYGVMLKDATSSFGMPEETNLGYILQKVLKEPARDSILVLQADSAKAPVDSVVKNSKK